MGVTAAIVGTALAVGASAYTAHKQVKAQEKAQERAAAQAREMAKNNVTVQTRAAEPTQAETQAEQSEVARQNAKRRRQGIARTVINNAQLTSSLLGNSNKLGG